MNITLWIIGSVLAFAFLAGGLMKLTQPKPKLVASGQPWAEDFSDSAVKGIGALEVLGALGLVLPALLDITPVLVPVAATGVVALMLGAAVIHARRGENIVVNVVLAGLAALVAVARFGPYAL
jgi:uncharacterized membrane protein